MARLCCRMRDRAPLIDDVIADLRQNGSQPTRNVHGGFIALQFSAFIALTYCLGICVYYLASSRLAPDAMMAAGKTRVPRHPASPIAVAVLFGVAAILTSCLVVWDLTRETRSQGRKQPFRVFLIAMPTWMGVAAYYVTNMVHVADSAEPEIDAPVS